MLFYEENFQDILKLFMVLHKQVSKGGDKKNIFYGGKAKIHALLFPQHYTNMPSIKYRVHGNLQLI